MPPCGEGVIGLMVQVSDKQRWQHLVELNTSKVCMTALAAPFLSLFLGAMLVYTLLGTTPATAANKKAAMVLDANTGKVLYSRNGDARRYPASLTKMMTLFMVFDEIKAGRLSFKTRIRMTASAAKRPPSKLGLKPGRTILLKDAVRALVTKSANDIAAAVAEHIAGSEAAFARRMTRRARSIGMSSTTFKNASGLTHEGQVTTARDMITLALRLQDDYPQHFYLFSTRAFKYHGKTYRNHNTLLRSMRGVNGIKTGYTRASGFNLVTSMRHGKKHLVAAVFGGKTARVRNARMRSLLYSGMRKASTRKTRRPAPMLLAKPTKIPRARRRVAARAEPAVKRASKAAQRTRKKTIVSGPPASPAPLPFRPAKATPPGREQPRLARTRLKQPQQQPRVAMARVRPVSVLAPKRVARTQLAPVMRPILPAQPARQRFARANTTQPALYNPSRAAVTRGRPPSTLNQQAARLASNRHYGAGLARAGTRWNLNGPRPNDGAAPRRVARTQNGAYQIQIGALPSAALAEQRARNVRAQVRGVLDGYRPLTMPVMVRGKQLWRVRFAGFASGQATNACNELRRNNIDCFVARP